jgi:RimJ/RimL family protein N-acetyltransferase
MALGDISSDLIEFRSIEDSDIDLIHQHQNGGCREEISQMLDFDDIWAPMTKAQIKEKLEEMRKEERTLIFTIWTRKEGQCVGMADYTASWDPWCPHFGVLIWPEFRRKGYGREAAELLLRACYERSPAHNVSGWCAEWNDAGIAFAESMGFTKCGVMRRCAFRNGEFADAIMFDMLRPEYLAKYGGGE